MRKNSKAKHTKRYDFRKFKIRLMIMILLIDAALVVDWLIR